MKLISRDQSSQIWASYWSALILSWFKVEVLQDYTGEDDGPSLQAWRAGRREESIQLLAEEARSSAWARQCQLIPGVRKTRVHVVVEPLSDYVQWELEVYKMINAPLAGEEILIVPARAVRHLVLPSGDFMIFDQQRVIVNQYDPTGKMIAADVYDEHDSIDHFIELQNQLLQVAIPLAEYQLSSTTKNS